GALSGFPQTEELSFELRCLHDIDHHHLLELTKNIFAATSGVSKVPKPFSPGGGADGLCQRAEPVPPSSC
ncbi:hypothetical protein EV182_004986, partial [Spiromyces aspiralis]